MLEAIKSDLFNANVKKCVDRLEAHISVAVIENLQLTEKIKTKINLKDNDFNDAILFIMTVLTALPIIVINDIAKDDRMQNVFQTYIENLQKYFKLLNKDK